MADVLRIERLRKSFGGVVAVNGPTFGIAEGNITGLIGPNGSGKTTLFNLITGVLEPDGGEVVFQGQRITGWPPHRITERGLARTFQISRVFGKMTVWENMLVVPRRRSESGARDLATELLSRVNLLDWRDRYGAELSYGQQKLLEFVRALMLEPTLIMLDEPFAGVNPTMVQSLPLSNRAALALVTATAAGGTYTASFMGTGANDDQNVARFNLFGKNLRGHDIRTNEQIRHLLLEEAGVAVVPFQAFGLKEDTGWFRLSVGAVSMEEIAAIFPRLRELLAADVTAPSAGTGRKKELVR